jgi:hypothetical protein
MGGIGGGVISLNRNNSIRLNPSHGPYSNLTKLSPREGGVSPWGTGFQIDPERVEFKDATSDLPLPRLIFKFNKALLTEGSQA